MQNLWSDEEAKAFKTDLEMRVYTSNLLGRSDELVLHGGGNTSVKTVTNGEDILLVKGSGWNLVDIKAEGFAPVKMKTLLEMAELKELSDSDMVSGQKAAMIDKSAPNPSVEAILHAIIPFKVVDHTHADAIVTMSNSVTGLQNIQKVFPNFLIIPYIMPGFILASKINEMIQGLDWSTCEGMILHNHGIFTFDDDAKKSYDKMIHAVTLAEDFLRENAAIIFDELTPKVFDVKKINIDAFMHINQTPLALHYASKDNLSAFATRGVLTPEHIIRTKRVPLILENENVEDALIAYEKEYIKYFEAFSKDEIMLHPKPKYAVIKDFGVVSFGKTQKEADVINDVVSHTMLAVLRADKLGGYTSISLKNSFEMEYWELEQAKLKK
ncbi:class II aldolase/adducin family protein [Sulfurimonas sp. SAG-AH-194-I05]|nr:class II aldolase/adducin family protein [Sulfurimonas sp. SAG-AH-194-I05]MDF1875403.1 class II aldolase/adducin family protein [Sulfurimonas sp. SAG-AH-194-I05]